MGIVCQLRAGSRYNQPAEAMASKRRSRIGNRTAVVVQEATSCCYSPSPSRKVAEGGEGSTRSRRHNCSEAAPTCDDPMKFAVTATQTCKSLLDAHPTATNSHQHRARYAPDVCLQTQYKPVKSMLMSFMLCHSFGSADWIARRPRGQWTPTRLALDVVLRRSADRLRDDKVGDASQLEEGLLLLNVDRRVGRHELASLLHGEDGRRPGSSAAGDEGGDAGDGGGVGCR